MKRIMIALSAAAMASGLRAAPSVAAEDFNDKTVADLTAWTNLAESVISTDAAKVNGTFGRPTYHVNAKTPVGANLAIKTPASTPTFFSFGSTSLGKAYVDSIMRFTACEDDATPSENAKIMFWAKAVSGTSGVTTNLMVTAGYLSDSTLSAKIYDCGPLTDYNGFLADGKDFCRVTVKSIAEIGASTGYSGFIVAVNGKVVTAAIDLGEDLPELAGAAKLWRKQNALFLSLKQNDPTMSRIAFTGQGAVDDIAIDSTDPTNEAGTQKFLDDPYEPIKPGTDSEVEIDPAGKSEAEQQAEAEKAAEKIPLEAADSDAAAAGQAAVLKRVVKPAGEGKFTVEVAIDTNKIVAVEKTETAFAVADEKGFASVVQATDGAEVSVSLPSSSVTPGLYYSIGVATDVGFTDATESPRVLATPSGLQGDLQVTKPTGGKGFFKVMVNTSKTPAN